MDIPNVSGPILGGNPDPISTYKIHHQPDSILEAILQLNL